MHEQCGVSLEKLSSSLPSLYITFIFGLDLLFDLVGTRCWVCLLLFFWYEVLKIKLNMKSQPNIKYKPMNGSNLVWTWCKLLLVILSLHAKSISKSFKDRLFGIKSHILEKIWLQSFAEITIAERCFFAGYVKDCSIIFRFPVISYGC